MTPMEAVYHQAQFSVDPRTKIGCVIVDRDRRRWLAFNKFPSDKMWTKENLDRLATDRDFKRRAVEHAERFAVRYALEAGESLVGSTAFINEIPCVDCTRALITAGVKKIITHRWWFEHCKIFGPSPFDKYYAYLELTKLAGVKTAIIDDNIQIQARRDDHNFMPNKAWMRQNAQCI